MAVDLSKTGEANVRSFPDQPCQNQNKTEFIKDKYSLITTDIATKLELSVNESDNLTHDYSVWKSIGYYDYILDTILNGYTIPFNSTPPLICLQNNRSAIIHGEFITEAIHDLLIRGLGEECENQRMLLIH